MGGERGTREKPISTTGTMAPSNTMAPTGTMGGRRHHERGTNAMMPSTRTNTTTRTNAGTRTNTGTNTMAPTGTTAGRGAHVHNPAFDKMRRVTTATRRFQIGTYVRPSGWYAHRWTFGEFLPAFFFVRTYWILDWGSFFLDAPPPGTVWVRVGDDAILIDQYTGEVIEVVYGIFY